MGQFGTEISGNPGAKAELLSNTLAAIVSAVEAGKKAAQVARDFGVNRSIIQRTVDRFHQRHDFESRDENWQV